MAQIPLAGEKQMIPEDFTGRKTTPDEFARYAVAHWGDAAYYWREKIMEGQDVTPAQRLKIDEAIAKHIGRVRKFLRVED